MHIFYFELEANAAIVYLAAVIAPALDIRNSFVLTPMSNMLQLFFSFAFLHPSLSSLLSFFSPKSVCAFSTP
jgi:hypothetical protein